MVVKKLGALVRSGWVDFNAERMSRRTVSVPSVAGSRERGECRYGERQTSAKEMVERESLRNTCCSKFQSIGHSVDDGVNSKSQTLSWFS